MLHTVGIILLISGAALVIAATVIFFITDCKEAFKDLRTTNTIMPVEDSMSAPAINDLYYDSYAEKPKEKSEPLYKRVESDHEGSRARRRPDAPSVQRISREDAPQAARSSIKETAPLRSEETIRQDPSETAPLMSKKDDHKTSVEEAASPAFDGKNETAPLISDAGKETAPLMQKDAQETAPLMQKEPRSVIDIISEELSLKGTAPLVNEETRSHDQKPDPSNDTAPLIEKSGQDTAPLLQESSTPSSSERSRKSPLKVLPTAPLVSVSKNTGDSGDTAPLR